MDYALLRLCIPFSGDPREQGRQIHFRRRNFKKIMQCHEKDISGDSKTENRKNKNLDHLLSE